MATSVSPPSFTKAKSLLKGRGRSGSADGTSGSTKTDGYGNPMMGALGNPAMHQQFSGQGSSIAQFGQMLWQDSAFKESQKSMDEAYGMLTTKMQNGLPFENALMEMLTENPKQLSMLDLKSPSDALKLKSELMMQANAGQSQTFDFGDGSKIRMVGGPDGKPHYMNETPASAANAQLARDKFNQPQLIPGAVGPGGGVAQRGPGGLSESPDFKPTSSVNADKRTEARKESGNWTFNPTTLQHEWRSHDPNVKPTSTPLDTLPVVKMNAAETQHFSQAPNLYSALSGLDKLANSVSGPVTGGFRMLSGRFLGEGEANVAWNTQLSLAKNAIASMGNAGGGYVAGMKERIDNLPKTLQAATQNKSLARGEMQHLQSAVATSAAALEGRGQLPEGVSDALTKMGVYTFRFAPARAKLKDDPSTMTPDEMRQLSRHGKQLPDEERAALQQEIQKRMGSRASHAVPTTEPVPE